MKRAEIIPKRNAISIGEISESKQDPAAHAEDIRENESNFEVISVKERDIESLHHLLIETTRSDWKAYRPPTGKHRESKTDIRVR
jgi:peptidoglycan/xylan/chitin deacetylase (PgdA/CDA1 family)